MTESLHRWQASNTRRDVQGGVALLKSLRAIYYYSVSWLSLHLFVVTADSRHGEGSILSDPYVLNHYDPFFEISCLLYVLYLFSC